VELHLVKQVSIAWTTRASSTRSVKIAKVGNLVYVEKQRAIPIRDSVKVVLVVAQALRSQKLLQNLHRTLTAPPGASATRLKVVLSGAWENATIPAALAPRNQ